MKRRILSLTLALCMLLTLIPSAGAYTLYSGDCGDDATWVLDSEGVLTISGTGSTWDCTPQYLNFDGDIVLGVSTASYSEYYSKVTKVVVEEGITALGSFSLWFAGYMEEVSLPDSLERIGEYSFWGCDSLTEIEIPKNVTAIEEKAFSQSYNLGKISVAEGNTAYCVDDRGVLYTANMDCLLQAPPSEIDGLHGNYTVADGVKRIAQSAFLGANINSVILPESVESIGANAFLSLGLTAVYFLGDAPEIDEASAHFSESATLYYIEGKEGWTTPEWNGYPTATWDGVVGFKDVPEGAWYVDAVNYVVDNGLMNGMGKNEFRPDEAMTRAMLVTVLWRYAGSPAEGTNGFHDLTQDWYVQAVAWASKHNIVNGYPDGTFKPDEKVTREQLATIVYRYCNTVGIDTSARADLTAFPDAKSINSYASDAISWAVSVGLITGITHGSNTTKYLEPQGNATRAQVATILMRFIENVVN